MHPTDHTSIYGPYLSAPNKSYGARYHKVTTSELSSLVGIPKVLANPKSATFRIKFFDSSKFWGFKSLCRILLL